MPDYFTDYAGASQNQQRLAVASPRTALLLALQTQSSNVPVSTLVPHDMKPTSLVVRFRGTVVEHHIRLVLSRFCSRKV